MKNSLLKDNSLETHLYYFLKHPEHVGELVSTNMSGEELLAVYGYLGKKIDAKEIQKIKNKRTVKGLNFTSNVYKLIGLDLASDGLLKEYIKDKFDSSSIKFKYLISKFHSEYLSQLKDLIRKSTNYLDRIISFIINGNMTAITVGLKADISEYLLNKHDIIDLIILEDLNEKLVKQLFMKNLSSVDIVSNILTNFSNAIMKIKKRRAEHEQFDFNDEYDVQDILYVMLKPIFTNLKDEDPIPKVGGRSSRIDLIIREENILIEVKMIKENEKDEKRVIDDLKQDLESYHVCQWIKFLFCFIYDPYNKTSDRANFKDLDGIRKKNNSEFKVFTHIAN